MMVESGAGNLSESTMIEAIELAHAEIKKIVAQIDQLKDLVGPTKRQVQVESIEPELEAGVKARVASPIREAILIPNKTARQEKLDEILKGVVQELASRRSGSRSGM